MDKNIKEKNPPEVEHTRSNDGNINKIRFTSIAFRFRLSQTQLAILQMSVM